MLEKLEAEGEMRRERLNMRLNDLPLRLKWGVSGAKLKLVRA
jgi:hypothetical protein